MIENTVHDHADASLVERVNRSLEADQAAGRLGRILDVAVLYTEEEERVVAPAERLVSPSGPRHELDGVDAKLQQMVEPGENRIDRCPVSTVVRGEVVNH
jgi:hypothetical protein